MFGLVELEYSWFFFDFFFGGGVNPYFFLLLFYLVRLWLGCIPKISFIACLEVPKKFVWWWWWVVVGGGWFRVNSVIAFGLALA